MKSRNIMYVQQLNRLPYPINELKHQAELMSDKYAYIIHDKDLKDGIKSEPHIHLIMNFKNPRSLSSIAKKLNDRETQITNMSKYGSNGFNNSISYLVHHSTGSIDKYQYDPAEVIANFDYIKELKKIENEVSSSKKGSRIRESQQVNDIFQKAGVGLLSINQTRQELLNISAKTLAQYSLKIDRLFKELSNIKYEEWISNKIEQKEPIEIIWIYGKSGTGKTKLARNIASMNSSDSFISGSSNDPFQGYEGQSCVILDELRPTTFNYEDLLRMLDPWAYDSMTSARYKNMHLMADIIIVTTPYNPLQFYQRIFNNKIDSFNQLLRRLSLILEVQADFIFPTTYSVENSIFTKNYDEKEKNTFSMNQTNNHVSLQSLITRKE
ncbi:Rep family protein [Lactobacillus terrae]|uniref:Rep family protein n=1 Tax=Lactobacillus terrae TaxID=2269374 RepID=UPI000C1B6DC8|nr:Rep family protein [Lactobacillus terrae]